MEVLLYCLAGVVLARHRSCQGFCRLLDQPVQAGVWFRVSAFGHWCFSTARLDHEKIHVRSIPFTLNPYPHAPVHAPRPQDACLVHGDLLHDARIILLKKLCKNATKEGEGQDARKFGSSVCEYFHVGLRGEGQDARKLASIMQSDQMSPTQRRWETSPGSMVQFLVKSHLRQSSPPRTQSRASPCSGSSRNPQGPSSH